MGPGQKSLQQSTSALDSALGCGLGPAFLWHTEKGWGRAARLHGAAYPCFGHTKFLIFQTLTNSLMCQKRGGHIRACLHASRALRYFLGVPSTVCLDVRMLSLHLNRARWNGNDDILQNDLQSLHALLPYRLCNSIGKDPGQQNLQPLNKDLLNLLTCRIMMTHLLNMYNYYII